MKPPIVIAILGMFLGVLIAVLFAANEDMFKGRIKEGLKKNEKIQGMSEGQAKQAKLDAEAGKCWRYYQRFHFHACGIAAMSLCLLILLGLSTAPRMFRLILAYVVSIPGFLYPFVWYFAAVYGPEMGRSEAKESFAIFGYMGGVFMIAAVAVIAMVLIYPIRFITCMKSGEQPAV